MKEVPAKKQPGNLTSRVVEEPPEDEPRSFHVVPQIGREHVLEETCWCWPEYYDFSRTVLVHNVMH